MKLNVQVRFSTVLLTIAFVVLLWNSQIKEANASLQAQIDRENKTMTISGQTTANQQVPIHITDPDNNLEYVGQIISDDNGSFSLTFTMISEVLDGPYAIVTGGESPEMHAAVAITPPPIPSDSNELDDRTEQPKENAKDSTKDNTKNNSVFIGGKQPQVNLPTANGAAQAQELLKKLTVLVTDTAAQLSTKQSVGDSGETINRLIRAVGAARYLLEIPPSEQIEAEWLNEWIASIGKALKDSGARERLAMDAMVLERDLAALVQRTAEQAGTHQMLTEHRGNVQVVRPADEDIPSLEGKAKQSAEAAGELQAVLRSAGISGAIPGRLVLDIHNQVFAVDTRIELPAALLTSLRQSGVHEIKLRLGSASLLFDLDAVERAKTDALAIIVSGKERNREKDEDVSVLKLMIHSVDSNGLEWPAASFKSAVRVNFPYMLGRAERMEEVAVFQLNDESYPKPSVYDTAGGKIAFEAYASGYYTIQNVQAKYTDIKDLPWAELYIRALAARGSDFGHQAVNEVALFRPNDPVTFEELVNGIANDLKLLDESRGQAFIRNISGAWTEAADSTLTREQMIGILASAMTQLNLPKSSEGNVLDPFADESELSDEARENVAFAVKYGLVSGRENNTFAPQSLTTRAEAAAVINRLWQLQVLLSTLTN